MRSQSIRPPRNRRLPHSLHSLAMTERTNSYMSSREGRRPTTRSRAYPYGNNSEIATVASQPRNDTEGSFLPVFARRSKTDDAISSCPISKRPEIASLIAFARNDRKGTSLHVFASRSKTDEAISGCPISKRSEIAALISFARKDNNGRLKVQRQPLTPNP